MTRSAGLGFPQTFTRASTITDNDGRYRLVLLTPHSYTLTFAHRAHAPIRREGVEVRVGATTYIAPVRLDTGVAIKGRALVDGAPRALVRVWLCGEQSEGVGFDAEDWSDRHGLLQFGRVPPGGSRAWIELPASAASARRLARQSLRLVSGGSDRWLEFRLSSTVAASAESAVGVLLLRPPIFAITASPNSEHLTSFAPSIRRAKS